MSVSGVESIRNYVEGVWVQSASTERVPVINPGTGEELSRTPLSLASEVDQAVLAAANAYPGWRNTPVTDRIQFLFKLKFLLEDKFRRHLPDHHD